MGVPLHKRLRRALRSVLLRGLAAALGVLPLPVAFRLGSVLGWLARHLARGERRRMEEQLALAFPEKAEAERRALVRGCFTHLGQLALETVVLRRRIAPHLAAYVSLAPGAEEVVRRAVARGRGVVFAAGHIGHWELLAQRLALVAQPAAVIARRSRMAWADAAVRELRAAGGVATLWRDEPGTARELIRLFRSGGSLGLLIDQDTRVQGVFVPFFGQLAFTPRAAGELALRFGATLLFVACHRRGGGAGDGHEVEVVEVPMDTEPADREREVVRVTAAAVALQEEAIRRHPEEWVWMHARWKTSPPAGEADPASRVPKSRDLSST